MKENKNNIFDYLEWRGDLSIANDPLNYIDFCIFSQLSMIDFALIVSPLAEKEVITIEEASSKYFAKDSDKALKLGLIVSNRIISLLIEAAKAKRFKDILLADYVSEVSIENDDQFSALTLKVDSNTYCISFSATDDTIIGWKENFDMIYKAPISGQVKATKYVSEVMSKYKDANFYICGHSKGGNFAIYSALTVKEADYKRIIKVYNFDGPGISRELLNKINNSSRNIKLLTILPQASTIGRMFIHNEEIKIINSSQLGLYQHDVFSWTIIGKDFITEEEATTNSKIVIERVNLVLEEMSAEEKEKFVQNTYKILEYTNVKDLLSLSTHKAKLIEGYFKLSKKDRAYVYNPVKKLLANNDVRIIVFDSLRAFFPANKDNDKAFKEASKIKAEKE